MKMQIYLSVFRLINKLLSEVISDSKSPIAKYLTQTRAGHQVASVLTGYLQFRPDTLLSCLFGGAVFDRRILSVIFV